MQIMTQNKLILLIMLKKNITKLFTHYATFIKSETAKSYGIILSGNVLTGLFGMIASIIIARVLGPKTFGLFSIAIAFQLILGTLIDFGFTKGFVSLLSNNKHKNSQGDIFASGFYFRIMFSFIIVLTGIFSSEFISKNVFHNMELITPLKITYLIIFTGGIWGILQLTLQASENFCNIKGYICNIKITVHFHSCLCFTNKSGHCSLDISVIIHCCCNLFIYIY